MSKTPALVETPVEGRFYMVPCIWYPWITDARYDWWPVIGQRHKDKQFLNFDHPHYHVDGRFLSKRQRAFATDWRHESLEYILAARPLNNRFRDPPAEQPTLKRRKCSSAHIEYGAHYQPTIQKLAEHFEGRRCRRGENGWVCPHQATPLGSIKPIQGVITCPLHGLRIDAATGVVMPGRAA